MIFNNIYNEVFSLSEWGKVVAVKGKTAILSIQKSEECDKCRKCRSGRGENEMIMEAKNKAGSHVGDTVEVNHQDLGHVEQLAVRMGIPVTDGIIGGIIGYMFGVLFHQTGSKLFLWTMLVGLLTMALSYVLSRRFLISIRRFKAHRFVVNSIIHKQG